jgi:hypothetical protein
MPSNTSKARQIYQNTESIPSNDPMPRFSIKAREIVPGAFDESLPSNGQRESRFSIKAREIVPGAFEETFPSSNPSGNRGGYFPATNTEMRLKQLTQSVEPDVPTRSITGRPVSPSRLRHMNETPANIQNQLLSVQQQRFYTSAAGSERGSSSFFDLDSSNNKTMMASKRDTLPLHSSRYQRAPAPFATSE